MTLQQAIDSDRSGALVDAAIQYEALLDVEPSLRLIIDLAVLYWTVTDPGMSGRVPLEFARQAGRRFPALLADAQVRFPSKSEPYFWHRYTDWADLGVALTVHECTEMMQRDPQCLVPSMYVFSVTNGDLERTRSLELLHQCEIDGTARARYVKSVIEGVLHRRQNDHV